jgi:hypothetical protein
MPRTAAGATHLAPSKKNPAASQCTEPRRFTGVDIVILAYKRPGGVVECKGAPMGQSVDSLPPEKKAEHYRELANQAVRQSQATVDPDRRASLVAMAASWHNLAVEAERLGSAPLPGELVPPGQPDAQAK